MLARSHEYGYSGEDAGGHGRLLEVRLEVEMNPLWSLLTVELCGSGVVKFVSKALAWSPKALLFFMALFVSGKSTFT